MVENFQGRNVHKFHSFRAKFSPWNLGVPYPLVIGFSILPKFSPQNGHFFYRSVKVFSLKKFLLYGIVWWVISLIFVESQRKASEKFLVILNSVTATKSKGVVLHVQMSSNIIYMYTLVIFNEYSEDMQHYCGDDPLIITLSPSYMCCAICNENESKCTI